MSWFKRNKEGITTSTSDKMEVPEGLWVRCSNCKTLLQVKIYSAIITSVTAVRIMSASVLLSILSSFLMMLNTKNSTKNSALVTLLVLLTPKNTQTA